MSKDKRKTNNKRDSKSQDNGPAMMAVRSSIVLRDLRPGTVIDFQGQPMIVRAIETEELGTKLSLSRALKIPTDDRGVKAGSTAAKHYEEWSFTTRPISSSLKVDRFRMIPDPNPRLRADVTRRKRAQASDRMEVG